MSDGEKTANLTGASGAGWSEREKIAYLVVLCENEGRIDSKISNAPIPAGRSVIACKKLITRLKEKYKEDIMRIKSGQPLDGSVNSETSEPLKTPKTPKTPRKRKNAAAVAEEEGSPKKKVATPRKTKNAAATEGTIKTEEIVKEDEEEFDCV